MGDNSDIVDDDYIYMDSESDGEYKLSPSPRPVRPHGSDSDLTLQNGTINGPTNLRKLKLKAMHLSDSKLYRGSKSPDGGKRKKGSLKLDVGNGSSLSLKDEVFEEESVDSAVDFSADKENSCEVKGPAVDAHSENVDSSCNSVSRSSSVGKFQDLTLKEHQVFYAGENGNIIVPKICLEGEEVYTTFEHIDTSDDLQTSLPDLDMEGYQNKVVAIEIAKEMAKLEKMKSLQSIQAVSEEDLPDMFAKDLNMVTKEKNGIVMSKSPKLSAKNGSSQINGTCDSSDPKDTKSYSEGAKSLIPKSPRFGQSNAEHVCGSLPYEQLKSSIPDVRISFHTENYEVIYINEKDESTKL